MLALFLLSTLQMECEIYHFDEDEIEFWYQVPVMQIFGSKEYSGSAEDTLFASYSYRLSVHSDAGSDSGIVEGKKKLPIVTARAPEELQITDYIPLTLYPGRFNIEFLMFTETDTGHFNTRIEIPEASDKLNSSDFLIGKKLLPGSAEYRKKPFHPSVSRHFSPGDTIVSYLELYGLQPDSLRYNVRYTIRDSAAKPVYAVQFKRLKTAPVQVETLSLNLGALVEGHYILSFTMDDSVSGQVIEREKQFTVEHDIDLSAGKQFYDNIEYLVSAKEFKKFKKLSVQEQRLYLKNFWIHHDYAEFEKRMIKANELFSTRTLKGCDSHRGRFLINHGEPEEREIMPMHEWARQLELWHFYSLSKDILFCDIKEDDNPQFIVELNVGELNQILEVGFADEDALKKWPWLLQIAPGTFREKWQEETEKDQENQ